MGATYLFPFDGGVDRGRRECHLPLILLPHVVQDLRELFVILVVDGHVNVAPPVARVEAPVHGPILQVPVDVTHELLGREAALAVLALDAFGVLASVQLGKAQAVGLTEALVVHGNGQGPLARSQHGAHLSIQQGTAQPFRVRLGDEPAAGGAAGQDALVLQHVELLGGAPGAVDLQLVALLVDLLQGEVPQHRVEHLGEAEAFLAAHYEARDGLALEHRLGPFAAGGVGGGQDRDLLYGKGSGHELFLFDLGRGQLILDGNEG